MNKYYSCLFVLLLAVIACTAISSDCKYSYSIDHECLRELDRRTSVELGDRIVRNKDSLKLIPKNGEEIVYRVENRINTGMKKRFLVKFVKEYNLLILLTILWETTVVEIINMDTGNRYNIVDGIPIFSPDMKYFASFYYDGEQGAQPAQIGIYRIVSKNDNFLIKEEYLFGTKGMITYLKWLSNDEIMFHQCEFLDGNNFTLEKKPIKDKKCSLHRNYGVFVDTIDLRNGKKTKNRATHNSE